MTKIFVGIIALTAATLTPAFAEEKRLDTQTLICMNKFVAEKGVACRLSGDCKSDADVVQKANNEWKAERFRKCGVKP
jgi:hypothetical protein